MQSLTANPVRLVAAIAVVAVLAGGMLVLKSTRGGSARLVRDGRAAAAAYLGEAPARAGGEDDGGEARREERGARTLRGPVHRTAVAPTGLPWSVQDALAHNSVVVVAVVSPKVPVDEMALAEAKAGAKSGKAGFVQVNAYARSRSGRSTR